MGKKRHKVDIELTKTKRDQLIVDIVTGATNYFQASKQIGISDSSIRRWFESVPEDEKLILAAQAKQRMEVAQKKDAAGILMSDGDDIDQDLRWLIKRLRDAVEACNDDEKLLELAQMREMRNNLMALAKVRGMFNQKIEVSFDMASSPQFLALRSLIIRVLERHPEAKHDFLNELEGMGIGQGPVLTDTR